MDPERMKTPPDYVAWEDHWETIRQEFFRVANIDVMCLDSSEVRHLLRLLPEVMALIHSQYDLLYVYKDDNEQEEGE